MNRFALLLAAALMLQQSPAHALGIAMRFSEITLEKVEPGASFNLRTLKNLPLVVINKDETKSVDIVVESVLPNPDEMKNDYVPVPDPTWVQIVPKRFTLGPKASASADVIVTIPNDPSLVGKHFEVILWARTETNRNRAITTGVVFEAGLRSRLRMSIGTMGPESLQREKALNKLATINTNFSISPDNVFVSQPVAVGREVDLKADHKATMKLINQSDDPIALKFKSAPPDPNTVPQAGFEDAPDPSWLTVEPKQIKAGGNSIKEIRLKLNIPDKPEYRGKKYMFIMQTTLVQEDLPLAYNNMLYVTTQP